MKPITKIKVRRFYPIHVMRRLVGIDASAISHGEKAALMFFLRRGRKYGMELSIINDVSPIVLAAANSQIEAETILASGRMTIGLREPGRKS